MRRRKPKIVWFNVKDYGARGDQVTDDTLAIAAAFRAAGEASRKPRRFGRRVEYRVKFPTGTYLVREPIGDE